MASPCIEDIIKAAEGTITPKDAGRILREMSHRAKALAQKENIPLPDAANRVAEEVAIQEELKVYVHKRAKLFALRAFKRGIEASKSTRGKNWADSFIEYLAEATNAGKSKSHAWSSRFFAELEENNALRELGNADDNLALDVFRERWALTSGEPPATKNKTAQVVAKAIRDIEKEYLALARKHGAWPQDAAGYTGPQTHNSTLLRQAGFNSGKRWGKENQDLAFETWYKFVTDENEINIDWDRTLPGADEAEKEQFLKSFFQSVYSGIHGETTELVDPSKRLGMGSLSERISSQRLFWFADAESQFKYNKRFGGKDFGQSILDEINSFGRNIAMLQYLGPSPENTFQRILKSLREDAKSLPNAQEMGKKLSIGAMQGYYNLVSGRADSSISSWLSDFTNAWKQITLMSKAGGIVFSMFGDRGFLDSGMARMGANALHRINVQIGKIAVNTPEGQRELKSLGFNAHAMATSIAQRYNSDARPFNVLNRGTSFLFKIQGADKLTNDARKKAVSAASENLGHYSSKSFDELPELLKVHLEGYQFSRQEWDIVRNTAFDISHEDMTWTVIVPDRMQRIPDDAIDKLLEADGVALSNPNRARKRDLLESKMSAYFSDVVDEMVPTPGLRQRYIMTGGGQQSGTLTRSALDLFFTFKGFGMTVAMRNARSYGRLWAAGQYKSVGMQVASLLAQTAALGYIGWAAREALKGRTPPLITDENGELDAKQFATVFMESLRRGGGLGIYGDYLLASYNRDNKTFLEGVAGPVLSELDPMAALGTSTVKTLFGEQEPASFALQSLRFAESNTPFINLFYTKFMLDQFFLWHLKEGLSPGIFRKTERNIGDQWRQEYYIEPVLD